jgi:hypothetical protein
MKEFDVIKTYEWNSFSTKIARGMQETSGSALLNDDCFYRDLQGDRLSVIFAVIPGLIIEDCL